MSTAGQFSTEGEAIASSSNAPDQPIRKPDGEDLDAKIEAYRSKAEVLARDYSGAHRYNTRWRAWNPGTDINYIGKWRLRIYELKGDHCDLGKGQEFKDLEPLRAYLKNECKVASTKATRRVVILEDMHPTVIEVLGALLNIPLEVFMAHHDENIDLSVVDSTYGMDSKDIYWKVPVPLELESDHYNLMHSTFSRGAFESNFSGRRSNRYTWVSYWGARYAYNSWAVVFIVDSIDDGFRLMSSRNTRETLELDAYKPGQPLCPKLGSIEIDRPGVKSIYDIMIRAHESRSIKPPENPFSATVIARNVIRSYWNRQIMKEELKWQSLWVNECDMSALNLPQQHDLMKNNTAMVMSFNQLAEDRKTTQRHHRDVQNITRKFQCQSPEIFEQSESMKQARLLERAEWSSLNEKSEVCERMAANNMEMYSQQATIIQAAAANRMARSSGQLTKIATIIVPCSFVASIFSMNGKYAAGEDQFFVYWAITIPIALCLLIWVIYGDILDAMAKFRWWVYSKIREQWTRRLETRFRTVWDYWGFLDIFGVARISRRRETSRNVFG